MAPASMAARMTLVLTVLLPSLAACTGDPPPSPTAAVTPTPSMAPTQARRLEAALRSGTAEGVRAALAVPTDQQLDPGLVAGLSGLTSVQVRESTFHQLDEKTATVEMTTQGTAGAQRWSVTLVRADGSWLIALTEPLP